MRQVKFTLGILGALFYKIKQFVFAGFATTKILQLSFADSFNASP